MNITNASSFLNVLNSLNSLDELKKNEYSNHLIMFLKQECNFNVFKEVFENSNDNTVKLILLDFLSKAVFRNLSKVDNIDNDPNRGYRGYNSDYMKIENEEYNVHLVNYFIYFLKVNSDNVPSYILNSIADFIGNSIKYFIYGGVEIVNLIEIIQNSFFGNANNSKDVYAGIKIYFYTITDILINTHHYEFFKFRRMLNYFQNHLLIRILNNSRLITKHLLLNYNSHGINEDLYSIILEIYFKCLIFPFNLSYFDFNTDANLEEITLSIFPEEYAESIQDLDFYDLLILSLNFKISVKTSFKVVKIFSRISSSRISLISDELHCSYKNKLISIFISCIEYHLPNNLSAMEEIIEFGMRMLLVFGIHYFRIFCENNKNFENAINKLIEYVMKNSNTMDDPVIYKMNQFCFKLRNLFENTNAFFFFGYCVQFLNYQFSINNSISLFNNQAKSFKSFHLQIDNRYYNFHEVLINNIKSLPIFYEIFMSLLNLVDSINSAEQFALFMTRYSQFLLIYTKVFISVDSQYSYNNYSYDTKIENYDELIENNKQLVVLICSEIFKKLPKISSFSCYVNSSIQFGFEMSLLYFFEKFANKSLEKNIFDSINQEIVIQDDFFIKVIANIGIQNGFSEFFEILTNKILGNLEYKNIALSKYSIYILNELIQRIKKILYGKVLNHYILDNFSKKLFFINNSSLSQPKFYKLRTDLYEVLGISYLNDVSCDYIQNSKKLFNQIIQSNTEDNKINLIHILYDIVGVFKSKFLSKIIVVFCKISYPKLQELLTNNAAQYLSNPDFLIALIDFYIIVINNTFQSYPNIQMNVIMIKIITDSCRIISMLVKEFNSSLELINEYNKKVAFIENNLKLIKRFIKIFSCIIKNADSCFAIFHYFGENVFTTFIVNIQKFMTLTYHFIFKYFPDKQDELIFCLVENCSTLSDFIIEYVPASEINEIFNISIQYFEIKLEIILQSSENKNVFEETFIHNLSSIINYISVSLNESINIYSNDCNIVVKNNEIIACCLANVNKFQCKLIEFSYLTNYNIQINNILSDMLFYLIANFGVESFINSLKENISSQLSSPKNNTIDDLNNCLSEFSQTSSFSFNNLNKDKFRDKFKGLIQSIGKIVRSNNK